MISLNEIPLENITLPIFKNWCDLLIFEHMLYFIIKEDNPSKKLFNKYNPVSLKVFRYFFRVLIYFKKMIIKIVDANINSQKSESSVDSFDKSFLMPVIERIKNCETIQDLIDGSPTAECPVCMDVTFTESNHFLIRVSCNHLVCLSCTEQIDELNNRLVKNIYYFSKSFD